MPITLRINFSGLCLLVPEAETTGRGQMHMLMPHVPGHLHGPNRHIPVLGFDTAHLREGSTGGDGFFAQFPLRDWVLEIKAADKNAVLDLCPQIVDLRPVTGKPVPTKLLRNDPDRRLAARVSLGQGERRGVARGHCWEWETGKLKTITHQVEWEITGLSDAPLELELRDFENTKTMKLPKLHPIPDDQASVINLFAHNVPSAELPPERDPEIHAPAIGDPPAHFAMYYTLFGGPVPVRLPRYWSDGADCPDPTPEDCTEVDDRGSSAFNCMIASAS